MWIVCINGTESTTVQPSVLPETVENNEETERPPTKQRLRSAPKTGMQKMINYSSHALSAN